MKDKILELFNESTYKPLVARDICKRLESDDLTLVIRTLNELEDELLVTHDAAGHFGLYKSFNIYLGCVDLKKSGFAFIKCDDLEEDIYVGKKDTLNALDKDTVLVKVIKDTPRHKEGKIVEIIKRNTTHLIGVLRKKNNHYRLFIPDNPYMLIVTIYPKNINNASVGDVVSVIITNFGDGRLMFGKVDKIIGKKDDCGMDFKIAIENSKIPVSFSSDAINEAISLDGNISFKDRVDLTNEVIVTIDGADAKDFDDAIRVKKIDNDTYLLGVYIADVSHYVRVNSYLDKDALNRGFSCYLPHEVIPMLPFVLSNELCSLKPNELRYVLACEMTIKNGEIIDSNIFNAVIKSYQRLTYDMVNAWYQDNTIPSDLFMLNDAFKLSDILSKKRKKLGSLDFDTKECKVILNDQLEAIDIKVCNRGLSEAMIEEFMICCNECVTERVAYLDLPFLYRIHEEPKKEKYNALIEIGNMLNVSIPKKHNSISPSLLQKILEKPTTKDAKRVFNHLVLRTMSKAKYSTNNVGHFGLAISNYTHFTSPIRRYPDLVVHRLIKDYLLNDSNYKNTILEEELENIACITSNKEKIIENLERDVIDMKKAEYMEKYIGKIYTGMISGVQKWGIYVELDNTCEGLVNNVYLKDYGYYYDDIKNVYRNVFGSILMIGSIVKVKVIDANKDNRTVDFEFIGDNDEK